MNSVHIPTFFSSSSSSSSRTLFPHLRNAHLYSHQNPKISHSVPISSSFSSSRRRRSRKKRPEPPSELPSEPKLQTVIDLNDLQSKTFSSFQSLLNSSESKFREFFSAGNEAFRDLQTLVTVDNDRRIVILCRHSTLRFMGSLLLCSCVIVFGIRVLVKLGSGFRGRFGFGDRVVVRRDRSLGGREVIVGRREENYTARKNFRVPGNPLSPVQVGNVPEVSERARKSRAWSGQKVPKWWPNPVPARSSLVNKEEYQSEANRLIRAIMDYRMSGRDVMEDDIIQLRQICRTSGVRVTFNTTNTRDSFYRASVDFVLNICSSAPTHSTHVQIDGEDVRQFLAGLAENIGLENLRAAIIVSAAVAARTRSCFLQAWAFEMQSKHSEAMVELSKICIVHRIFPPEKSSPEMEMVARGLEKHLKVEQREVLLDLLAGICGEGSQSAVEALGLMHSLEDAGDHQENKYL